MIQVKKVKEKNAVASFSMTSLPNQRKTIRLKDIFDAFIEKFRILLVAVSAIKKKKDIIFDDNKIYQLAM